MNILRLGGILLIIVSILCIVFLILGIGNSLVCVGVILLCQSTLIAFSAANMSADYERAQEKLKENKQNEK